MYHSRLFVCHSVLLDIDGAIAIHIQCGAGLSAQRIVIVAHRHEAGLGGLLQLAEQVVSALRDREAAAEGRPLLPEDAPGDVRVTLRPARPGLGLLPHAAAAVQPPKAGRSCSGEWNESSSTGDSCVKREGPLFDYLSVTLHFLRPRHDPDIAALRHLYATL